MRGQVGSPGAACRGDAIPRRGGYPGAPIQVGGHDLDEPLIPRPLATKLLFEAQKRPDEEVCGLVGAGDDGLPRSLYPVANAAAERAHRFEMDPEDQIRAMKEMRERGESLWAVYHSHPDAPPEPSARDLAEIGYPEALYLIISLNIKGVLEMRAWRPDDTGGMREVTLRVMD